jgi:hypothetical protein
MVGEDPEYFEGHQRNVDTRKGIQRTFCKTCKTCPSVSIHENLDSVILGGREEGYTVWKKGHFKDMVEDIKAGIFDRFIGDGDN